MIGAFAVAHSTRFARGDARAARSPGDTPGPPLARTLARTARKLAPIHRAMITDSWIVRYRSLDSLRSWERSRCSLAGGAPPDPRSLAHSLGQLASSQADGGGAGEMEGGEESPPSNPPLYLPDVFVIALRSRLARA